MRRGRLGRGKPAAAMRRKVRARDGDWCWICGEWALEGRPQTDPDQATLDHVVPVSCGGTDDLENLRLAHFRCNSERANVRRDREPALCDLLLAVERMFCWEAQT